MSNSLSISIFRYKSSPLLDLICQIDIKIKSYRKPAMTEKQQNLNTIILAHRM